MYRILQGQPQPVQACKIWAYAAYPNVIRVATPNEPSCFEFHVALTLNVSGVSGTTSQVLDAALFPNGPVLTADWKAALQGASEFKESSPRLYTLSEGGDRTTDDDFSTTDSDLTVARSGLGESRRSAAWTAALLPK